jgi:hypothetical protein
VALGGGLGSQGEGNICSCLERYSLHISHPLVQSVYRASVVGSRSSAARGVAVYLNKMEKRDGEWLKCGECG